MKKSVPSRPSLRGSISRRPFLVPRTPPPSRSSTPAPSPTRSSHSPSQVPFHRHVPSSSPPSLIRWSTPNLPRSSSSRRTRARPPSRRWTRSRPWSARPRTGTRRIPSLPPRPRRPRPPTPHPSSPSPSTSVTSRPSRRSRPVEASRRLVRPGELAGPQLRGSSSSSPPPLAHLPRRMATESPAPHLVQMRPARLPQASAPRPSNSPRPTSMSNRPPPPDPEAPGPQVRPGRSSPRRLERS
jgi:hypothetical protein